MGRGGKSVTGVLDRAGLEREVQGSGKPIVVDGRWSTQALFA